jgi:hypothetical protein
MSGKNDLTGPIGADESLAGTGTWSGTEHVRARPLNGCNRCTQSLEARPDNLSRVVASKPELLALKIDDGPDAINESILPVETHR